MASPFRIRVLRGDEVLSEQTFCDDIVKIGKHKTAQVCLPDRTVGTIHAVLTTEADSIAITDVSGTRGTRVNGQPIGKRVLEEGDRIQIGSLTLLVDRPFLQPAPAATATLPLAAEPPPPSPSPSHSPAPGPAVPEPEQGPGPRQGQESRPESQPPQAQPSAAQTAAAPPPAADAPDRVPAAPEPPAPRPPPPRPPRELGESPVLQLACYWGDTLLQVSQHARPEPIRIGQSKRCALRVGCAEHLIAEPHEGTFALHVDAGARGFRRRGGGEAVERLGPGIHLLEPKDFAWIELDGLRVEASFAGRPRRAKAPVSAVIDYRLVNLVLALTFVAGLFAISAEMREDIPISGDDFAEPSLRLATRLVAQPIRLPPVARTDAISDLSDPEPLARTPRHSGPEGEAGDPAKPRLKPKIGGVTLDGKSLLAAADLANRLGGGRVFAPQGIGTELGSALANVHGAELGANGGANGMGLRDSGWGGGGNERTFGIGDVFSPGKKLRGGSTRGPSLGPGSKSGPPQVDSTPPDVSGSLDPDLVRRIIRSHVNQIRYCYEQELIRSPDLAGKVRVRFVVAPNGEVPEASIAEGTTISEPRLRACILSRVRGWVFPAPKGGGSAIVTYPFWLTRSGS